MYRLLYLFSLLFLALNLISAQGGTIAGFVLEDTDNDGFGNIRVEGVPITLKDGQGNVYATDVTDSNGNYFFGGLPTSIFKVVQTNLSGYADVNDIDGGDPNEISLFLGMNQLIFNQFFVDEQLGSISGKLLEDTNNDGVGNSGIQGSVITLLDNLGNTIKVDITNANGDYIFQGLTLGEYKIVQTNLPNYIDVNDIDGGDPNQINVALAYNEDKTGQNFVDEQRSSISGSVLEDIDNDAMGDQPIQGTMITLWDNLGNVINTDITDENGSYSFFDLPIGSYEVRQTNLIGFDDVSDIDGGDPNVIEINLGYSTDLLDQDFIDIQSNYCSFCNLTVTAFGANTGRYGMANTFFGSFAGNTTTGEGNTLIGHLSGFMNQSGARNTFIGDQSGFNNIDGSNNLYLGYNAGLNATNTSSNNIIIGSNAGPVSSTVVSDKLYIDNYASDNPLIYAEFDNDHVIINGTFDVTAGLSNPSSRKLKEDFKPVDGLTIIDKITQLDIEEWRYRRHPNQRHIGPTAEDFHKAFGLGKDNNSISTIDASGIALIAIQELKKENDELKELIKQMQNRLKILEIRNE